MQLIEALKAGEVVSGEALGTRLGISRAAVWKQFRKLESLGIPVESVRGLGYCIPGGLDLLDRHAIAQAYSVLAKAEPLPALRLHTVIDSTSREAMDALQTRGELKQFHFAECQTAGRGRRGRSWVSPFGASLYLSVAWQFEEGVTALVGLSLAVGVAVRRALVSVGAAKVALKWPNDLLVDGAKLGGVLVEIAGDPSDCCRVVVGVGVNVRTPPPAAEAIEQPWVNLADLVPVPPSRNELAGALIFHIEALLSTYGPGAFDAYRAEWMAADALAGRTVTLSTPSQQVRGVARGIDEGGAVLIEVGGEVLAYSGGELSLKAVKS